MIHSCFVHATWALMCAIHYMHEITTGNKIIAIINVFLKKYIYIYHLMKMVIITILYFSQQISFQVNGDYIRILNVYIVKLTSYLKNELT